jgi:Ca2+-transporting ATPase
VVMITGDAPDTAMAIAQSIGLRAQKAIHGAQLAELSDDQLRAALREETLFARTTPEQKMRIVTLLQEMGHVVGMTGDGVNDAPALKKADIGISMGLRGTDVAKSASDMVLLDDNFASIIGAVEEGRRQYDNIQKFVRYLLSSNTAELIAIFLNILLGGPLILLPVQILWMNLVTDGLTSVALGVEKPEKGVMHRPPRSPMENILNRVGIATIAVIGGYMGLATLWVFHHYLGQGQSVALAQTAAFTGLILMEKMNVFNFRSLREPLPVIGFFSNPWVLLAWSGTIAVQVGTVYLPFLQNALHTVPLNLQDWGLMVVMAAPVFILVEAYKAFRWWILKHRG